MEESRKLKVKADGVEIFRKSRPHSPSRGKVYITDKKKYPQKREAITRWHGEQSTKAGGAAGGGQRSIFDPSIPPISTVGDGCQPKDFANQVVATDIEKQDSTQTGSSLRESSSQLPKRNPDRVRCRSGRRGWNHCCESPRPCCGNRICSGDLRDFQVQADPREIGSSESVQTGPSLAASGSFCRFDYKLRKVKKWPADSSRQCECPIKPEYHVTCAENRDGCGTFHQQVKSTDILLSDDVQTGQLGQCTEGDIILYGDAKRSPTRAYRRPNGSDDFRSCECRGTVGDAPTQRQNFGMQVAATNISPTKCSQTERCLSSACISARKIRNTDWDECQRSACKRAPSSGGGGGEKRSVGQGVRPLDISECTEMQTESPTDLKGSCGRKREVCPGKQREGQTVRVGRAKDIGSDCARPLVDRPRNVKVAEQSTQVKPQDINVCDTMQTN